jgi:TRAP-type mannitol/chloroaromatic compound transport system permease small subunit
MPLTGLLLAIQGVSEFCKSLDAAISGRWADGGVAALPGKEAV